MNVPNWLITDTKMYRWIIKICYLRLVYPNNVPKVREYMIEFDNGDRYVAEVTINKKMYKCIMYLNNTIIYEFEFVDPIDFATNLCDSDNTKIATFVGLVIDQIGFNVSQIKLK